MLGDEEDARTYDVVMNHEEQYSIWLADRVIPAGWVAVGKRGRKAECLQYIDQVWTDMRPLSLRKQMEAMRTETQGSDDEAMADPGWTGSVATPSRSESVSTISQR